MPAVIFSHPQVGTLTIDNGVNDIQWAYGLNTATFPTYGGEVVQILSVYIDDVTIDGVVTTYHQMETIYRFFGAYMQIATQGKKPTPNIKDSTSSSAYNLQPVTFRYPHRNWEFQLYPKQAAGFRYGLDVVTPTWQVTCFVIDDTPDLELIKDGVKATVTKSGVPDKALQGTFNLTGEISPGRGNPDTDPFQTYTPDSNYNDLIGKYADYYNSLIPAYQRGDFSALTGAIGSKPNLGKRGGPQKSSSSVKVPKPNSGGKSKKGKIGSGLNRLGGGGG